VTESSVPAQCGRGGISYRNAANADLAGSRIRRSTASLHRNSFSHLIERRTVAALSARA
jgi:hypothetical protein